MDLPDTIIPIFQLENLVKIRTDESGRPQQILKDLSLTVRRGALTAIVGPSGGGKSSLLRLINRLEDPASGRILLDGEDIATLPPVALRRQIAMVPQKTVLFSGTVLENLQRPFLFRKEPLPGGDAELLRQVLGQCGLAADILGREARTLSGGEQQRVALARALVSGPKILLLDEPTSALDRPSGDRLAATLLQICRESRLTILMVTHDLRLTARVAEDLAFLEAGKILEAGPARQLLSAPQSAGLRQFLAEPDSASRDEKGEKEG